MNKTENLHRRAEILSSAKRCFKRSGLHGASVSSIASEAHLSVGQLYRVFQSKEEIIEEIVNDIVSHKLEYMVSNNILTGNEDEFAKILLEIKRSLGKDDFLLMEINAEASRNKKFLDIIVSADKRLKKQGGEQIKNMHPEFSESQVKILIEFLAIIFDGVLYRQNIWAVQEDTVFLTELYKEIFRKIKK